MRGAGDPGERPLTRLPSYAGRVGSGRAAGSASVVSVRPVQHLITLANGENQCITHWTRLSLPPTEGGQ